VLTVRGGEDAVVSDIRFAAPGAHWAGAFASLRVDAVRSEALRRAERMARYHLTRTTQVRLADLGRPSAVLSRRQWAIASVVDGATSVQDLAWQCGMALYDAIECVGHLVRAGLCVQCGSRPTAPSGPHEPRQRQEVTGLVLPPPALEAGPITSPAALPPAPVMAPAPALAPVPALPPAPVMAPAPSLAGRPDPTTLPHRRPGPLMLPPQPVMGASLAIADVRLPDVSEYAPAAPDLLRRVLDGLRKIS
jgi:hypothetical protein